MVLGDFLSRQPGRQQWSTLNNTYFIQYERYSKKGITKMHCEKTHLWYRLGHKLSLEVWKSPTVQGTMAKSS